MNDLLTQRHELCLRLYHAGMNWDKAEVARLKQQLCKLDAALDVPELSITQEVPAVGDLIYFPTRISIDHGYDDVAGGVGVVMAVEEGISAGHGAIFVRAHEQPGRGYNWAFLKQEQAIIKKNYGKHWARPDPDL
jgi:hypothetical protein